MSSTEIQQILGAIETSRQEQRDWRDEHSKQLDTLFRKADETKDAINNQSRNGCAVGEQHSLDIAELKERPNKALAAISTVGGIISLLAAAWAWMHGNMK